MKRILSDWQCARTDPYSILPALAEATAWLEGRIDYFGASEPTIFSKRGSPRSGSQKGSSFNAP